METGADSKSSLRQDSSQRRTSTSTSFGRRKSNSTNLAAAFDDSEEPPPTSSRSGNVARRLTRNLTQQGSKQTSDLADIAALALAHSRHERQVSDSTGSSKSVQDDGDANALVGQDDGRVQLLDLASGREIRVFTGHSKRIEAICADWKSQQAISAGGDGHVFLWDLTIGIGSELRAEGLRRCCTRALVADWTEGKAKALSGNDDGRLVLWDLEKRQAEKVYNCHLGLIVSVSADFTKLRVLVSHGDHSLDLISMKDGARLKSIGTHHVMATVLSVAWHKARAILGMEDGAIQQMDLRGGSSEATLRGHRSSISVMAVQWKHARAITGSFDKTLRLWNLKKTECIRIIGGHPDALRTLSVDWEIGVALSSSWDGEMQLWEVADDGDGSLQPVGGEARVGGACLLSVSEAALADDENDSGLEDL